jgi:signal transduction histidine kinase
LKILIIDDNPDDRLLVHRELAREFPSAQIVELATPQGLDRAIAEDGFDLVITDFQLQWSDGLAVLDELKRAYPECPVIMFTASGNQEIAVEAMKRGLDDYIVKSPKHLVRLRASARLALERAEARRRANHLDERLRGLLDRLDVGVFRARPDGTIVEANPAFLRLLGLDGLPEGHSLGDHGLGPPTWPGGVMADPGAGHPKLGREVRLERLDGGPIWALLNVTPGRDLDGGEVLDGLMADVSEMRRAREEAEEANRAKDRFLAMLSHELRTPLTPVLATVTAMIDEPETPAEIRPTLDMIRRSVELEARLIDDLLDVTRVLHGKLRLHPEPVDLHELIHQTLRICRSELQGSRMRLDLRLEASAHVVQGDLARLQQVVWNLVKNAIKFSAPGGRLSIRTENAPPTADGPVVAVEIIDEGIGIDAGVLPQIFEPFVQGEPGRDRQFGGLGLGLAIGRSVAEAHGGRLLASSAGPGRGATFRVELPALPVGSEPPRLEPRAVPGSTARPLSILFVEDDPPSRTVLSRLLRQRGHAVVAADSVAQGLAEAASGQFDLLISDIGLPDGTGLDLLVTLQASRPMPAIALTGFGMDADRRQIQDAGFAVQLTKPVDFARLEAAIREVTSTAPPANDG